MSTTASEHGRPSLGDRLFALLQLCLPTHALSLLAHRITRSQRPWLKRRLIGVFMRKFGITLDQACVKDPEEFLSFNHFFTRALAPGARPLDATQGAVVSPVDGAISELGNVTQGEIFQAKGKTYSATTLLADAEAAEPYLGGQFCTIYLSPRDYHRIHMPLDGTLEHIEYVPGRLFSVNPATVRAMPRLFARNERIALHFDTAMGPFALVMVGATLVGGMETIWTGPITPPHGRRAHRPALHGKRQIAAGADLGRFNMGSTVILLTGPGAVSWHDGLAADSVLRMGQLLATRHAGS